jgi:hypothetical protein
MNAKRMINPSFRGARSANPEFNHKDKAHGWIPGPACGRPGMTLQVDQ